MFRSPVQLFYSCVRFFPSGHPQDRRAPRTNHWTSRRLLEPVKVSVDIWHAQVIKAHIEHKWIINEYNAHINPMLIQYSCLLRFQIWFQIPGGKSRTRRDLGTTSGIETVHASKNVELNVFPLSSLTYNFAMDQGAIHFQRPDTSCQPTRSHDSKRLWMYAKHIWHPM